MPAARAAGPCAHLLLPLLLLVTLVLLVPVRSVRHHCHSDSARRRRRHGVRSRAEQRENGIVVAPRRVAAGCAQPPGCTRCCQQARVCPQSCQQDPTAASHTTWPSTLLTVRNVARGKATSCALRGCKINAAAGSHGACAGMQFTGWGSRGSGTCAIGRASRALILVFAVLWFRVG